jgi:hypothetical protein
MKRTALLSALWSALTSCSDSGRDACDTKRVMNVDDGDDDEEEDDEDDEDDDEESTMTAAKRPGADCSTMRAPKQTSTRSADDSALPLTLVAWPLPLVALPMALPMPLALERETASTGGGMGASRARSERGESSGAGATLAVWVALANGAEAAVDAELEEEEVEDEEEEGAGERGDEKLACGWLGAAAGAGDAKDDDDEDEEEEDEEDDDGARRSVRCRIDDADASVAKMSLVEVSAEAPAGGAAVAGERLLQSTGDRKEARDETILQWEM